MLKEELRELSEVFDTKPTFLSIYLNFENNLDTKFLERRERECSKILRNDRELKEAFEKNLKKIKEYLDRTYIHEKGVAIFSSQVNNFFKAYQIPIKLENLFVVDTSPYIRPLALYLEEYENFCIILIDHSNAKMFLVTASKVTDKKEIHKDIFHHHKKGGWSQMRYQRIRDGKILHFFKEVVEDITKMLENENVRRIIIAGPKVAKKEFLKYLPKELNEKIIGFFETDIDTPENELLKEAFSIFFDKEREEEKEMVDKLRNEVLKDGLATYGVNETLKALEQGKAEKILVNMGTKVRGWKCERCRVVEKGDAKTCKYCNLDVYTVDVIEEIVEEAQKMDCEMEFIKPNDVLEELGGIGAFLRYR